jgi:type I restriction enzyme S subunit
MKWNRATLGELCVLEKGTSPISRTRPGPYPFVTTAADRRSAATFQFDADAACIPLISSTGHGHASLKRVHFQSGKFALANLLVAAIPRNPEIISARFLSRYLNYVKDRRIVPLMTGTANMSVSRERLMSVLVEYPSLTEQNRVTSVLDRADHLHALRASASMRAAHLVTALFQEMFASSIHEPRTQIKDVANLVNGRAFKPSEWGKGRIADSANTKPEG